jgi:hypothetical protein
MIRAIAILFFSLYLGQIQGQFSDDFSDGDFSINPTWSGDTGEFKVSSSKQLQLNGSGTDTSFLVTQNTSLVNAEWSFYIKQSFNSSSNNHTRIYLCSDQMDLKGNINGYYIQYGSTQDDIVLYRQDGNQSVALISSIQGLTGNSTNPYTLKVTRDLNGIWELWADPNQGTQYQLVGSTKDTTYTNSNYFGVWCKYTSSNSSKVYFDDFVVQTIQVDSFPPVLQSLSVLSPQQIELFFSESIDSLSASNTMNYQLNNGMGKPVNALWDETQNNRVVLSFSQSLSLGLNYLLSVDQIEDLVGNAMQLQQFPFDYYVAQPGDVVINEIMADPTPIVGLPDKEYLELYNNSAFTLSLASWKLQIGSKQFLLPDSLLAPNSYVILCEEDDVADFNSYGKLIPLESISLVNGGTQLILQNDKGTLIHQVAYSDSWYGQSSKADGGWSLEQIDPDNYCSGSSNWWASNDLKGGTPGQQNSIFASAPDLTTPEVARIAVVDSLHLDIVFTESMDSSFLFRPSTYSIDQNIGSPVLISSNFPIYDRVTLSLQNSLQKATVYKLQIGDTLKDCAGNTILIPSVLSFGIGEKPEKFDLVINEVLFNPKDNGVDYVEIYNRSEKIIDIRDMRLANYDDFILDYDNISVISEEAFTLFPGEYWILCTAPQIVKNQFLCKHPNNFIEMVDFISLPNSEGNVYLLTPALQVIDSLDYSEDMQFSMLSSLDGVSLERINYNEQGINNWHSASESSGFGTPTYQNSQFRTQGQSSGSISLENEIFSPDNDGYQDLLGIQYELEVGTIISSMVIYDAVGNKIKVLEQNFLAGGSGTLYWDGLDDQNQKAPIGVYIIFVETLNAQGNVERFKLKTTLAGKL